MSEERRSEADKLVRAALELDASERRAFLTQACQESALEVEQLLAACESDATVAPGPIKSVPISSGRQPIALDGSQIVDGTYRIEAKLGAGGMGEVFRARHLELDKAFALKVLIGDDLDAEHLRRFRVEARSLARLDHPGIVRVTDFGVDEAAALPYLVMELVGGDSLSRTLRRESRWSVSEALEVLHQLAAALDYAHGNGILHRDLKPANIIIGEREGRRVGRLVDFGLARMMWAESHESDDTLRPIAKPLPTTFDDDEATVQVEATTSNSEIDAALMDRTQDGQVVGTPKYMAPETCLGYSATQASDIYALALVAYELICARPLFDGPIVEVMKAHVHQDPPPPSSVDPELPFELDVPMLRGLAKFSEGRPQTATAFVDGLETAWRAARLRQSLAATRKPRRRALLGLGAVGLAIALLASGHPGPPGVDTLERWSLDARMALAPSRAPDPRLALALIDEETLDADPESKRVADYHGAVAETLSKLFDAGLEGVCLDMLLPDFWATDAFVDLILDNHQRIILAVHSDGSSGRVYGAEVLEGPVTVALGPDGVRELLGWATLQLDRDEVPRRMRYAYADRDGRVLPTLSARIAEHLGSPQAEIPGRDYFVDFRQDRASLPIFGWSELETIAASEPERLAGRFLVVSFSVGGLGDQDYPTPPRLDQARRIDGAELQTLAASSLSTGGALQPTPVWLGVVPVLLGLPLLAALLCDRRLLMMLVPAVIAWSAAAGIAWLAFDRVVAVAAPLLALIVTALIAAALGRKWHRDEILEKQT